MRPDVSIIIPTLNEARSIGATLEAVARVGGRVELIVVDGGSTDETVELARRAGAIVLAAERGRGSQMHAGALASRGAALWFVHADTLVPAEGAELIRAALEDPNVVGGNFRIRFDGATRAARFLSWLYPQLRRIGLCYGDSAIFVRRESYERAGGYKPYPIFEDLDLLRALWRQGDVRQLPATVLTSSRRFEGRSFALTFARWSLLQLLFWLGVQPRTLARLYAPIRAAREKRREKRGARGSGERSADSGKREHAAPEDTRTGRV
jgi:rSAM/selenodomain-associated transferase 2